MMIQQRNIELDKNLVLNNVIMTQVLCQNNFHTYQSCHNYVLC